MRRAALLLLVVFAALPPAAAHGREHGLEQQLQERGEALLLGGFDAPQPGALVVVPLLEGPLPCGDASGAGYAVPLGGGAVVAFVANATHLGAVLDLPRPGFAAFALDTATAARTLLLMQEQAVALHRLAAAAPNGSALDARGGVLGIPYALPGSHGHGFGPIAPEEVGLRLAWEGPAEACAGAPGHLTLALPRERAAWAPGSVVHAVALWDPEVPQFLPRPLDSTRVLQANLYLARPGEDAAQVRAALAQGVGAEAAVPLLGLLAGAGFLARRTD
jgi:hypothetical protein